MRTRKRVPRKLTVGERISRLIGAPHLSRSKRMQRTAIIAMVVLLGVYLLVWPIVSDMFGNSKPAVSPGVPSPRALGKKK